MKVAIVGIYPQNEDRIRGGVEAVTLALSRGLAAMEGIEVHVVVCDATRPTGDISPAPGLHVHSIGGAKRFGNILLGIPDRQRIARALRGIAPDVVHAHSADRSALGAMESGFPTVVTIHGIIEMETSLESNAAGKLRGLLRNMITAEALRKMKNVILLSPYVAEYYAKQLAGRRTWTIENPVDERFFALRRDVRPGTLLHSGLLIPRKGIRNLLEALHLASHDAPGIRLRLAGASTIPEYRRKIDDTISWFNLTDRVDFLGGLSPAEVAEELSRAAALVMVSRQETLPVAIQEAMAAGVPVIASPVGGIPMIVREGETGYLVEYGDAKALAKRMVEIVTDDEVRLRMGTRGREIAKERFTLESVCQRTVAVYREVIAGR